jgi:hypothetical protein
MFKFFVKEKKGSKNNIAVLKLLKKRVLALPMRHFPAELARKDFFLNRIFLI